MLHLGLKDSVKKKKKLLQQRSTDDPKPDTIQTRGVVGDAVVTLLFRVVCHPHGRIQCDFMITILS